MMKSGAARRLSCSDIEYAAFRAGYGAGSEVALYNELGACVVDAPTITRYSDWIAVSRPAYIDGFWMIPVAADNLIAIGWRPCKGGHDVHAGTLRVRFQDKTFREYRNVSHDIYERLLGADENGRNESMRRLTGDVVSNVVTVSDPA